MKTEFIKWFTNGNNGRAPEIKEDGEFVQMKTRHMFEAYQAGANSGEITALVATHEKCREITNCPGEVDLQDWVKQLAAENVAIREQSDEVYAAGYNHGHLNTVDGIAYADCVKDDFYSLALQVMAEVETPATDHIVAGIKADGVEEFADHLLSMDCQLEATWAKSFIAEVLNVKGR